MPRRGRVEFPGHPCPAFWPRRGCSTLIAATLLSTLRAQPSSSYTHASGMPRLVASSLLACSLPGRCCSNSHSSGDSTRAVDTQNTMSSPAALGLPLSLLWTLPLHPSMMHGPGPAMSLSQLSTGLLVAAARHAAQKTRQCSQWSHRGRRLRDRDRARALARSLPPAPSLRTRLGLSC